jgi:superfamily II DNA or RNA helicase
MSLSKPLRPYQRDADQSIEVYFQTKNRGLVKMFCGTGKSLLMRHGKAFQNHSLIVYVFPSLSLIEQFKMDYLQDITTPLIIVSSDDEGTTDEEKIQTFLQKPENKILCITYQSFHLIKDVQIPMCVLDEAHHVTSETYQPLFLENSNIQKMCLFTATPKKMKGVDYGELIYEYSYLRGVAEGYLNPFEIRVDLVGETNNKTIYNSIARAYYTTGNNRILTFHADVNTVSPTSVRNFVNEKEIKKSFKFIQPEFPTKRIPKIHVVGFYSEMKAKERRALLETFDASQDVFILCSCETMGEGVDTKNANMCVFVDPKSSFVKIIQNIGRIVRKQFSVDKPHSTILLPIYIDKTKYESCTTSEECDMAIRQDMAKGGDFTPILNVLSALKQEDEYLYEICLHYPNEYSPQEIEENLRTQGHTIGEQVDIDEVLQRVEEEDVQVDVHTNSLEQPIISHGESEHVINVLQEGDEYYQIEGEETKIEPPKQRVKMTVHTNPDVKVFWKLEGELNLGSCLMDCEVIDNWNERLEELRTFLEKEKRRPIQKKEKIGEWLSNQQQRYTTTRFNTNHERCKQWEEFIEKHKEYFQTFDDKGIKIANDIVKRSKERVLNGGRALPRELDKHDTPELHKEWQDCVKLSRWKRVVNKGDKNGRCCKEIIEILDIGLPGWRDDLSVEQKAIKYAEDIIQRAFDRQKNGENLIPKIKSNREGNTKLELEHTDARKLDTWKQCLNGKPKSGQLFDSVKELLNTHLPDWNNRPYNSTMPNFEKFYDNINECKKIMKNKSGILQKTDSLYNWFHNMKKNYKTKTQIMKDEEIRKHWEEFMKFIDNKDYLTPKKSMKYRIIPFEEPSESSEQKRIRVKSELSVLHQQYKTMRSDTLAQYLVDHPTAWHDYHGISETNEETFPSESIPRNQLIYKLEQLQMKKDRPKDVLDLGCGKALIAKHFQDKGDTRFKFTNIDHVAINETVQVGDISKLPFEDNSVDICILSLAMWGSNCKEYIQEVHRVLETNGILYIIEPTKRWTETETEPAGRLREWLKDFHICQESIEKFTFFVAMKLKK